VACDCLAGPSGGRSWEEQSPNFALQCAQCAFDTATFLDRRLAPAPVDPLSEEVLRALVEGRDVPDPSGPFQPRELQCQQKDLAAIGTAGPQNWEAVLAQLRRASQAYAVEFFAALAPTFHDG
jgi:hypothetical protein